MLLEVQDLSLRFGGVHVLSNVSFGVAGREICGVIGPNGAGKTSLFNVLSRIYDATTGRIRFGGQDVLALAPHRMPHLGIARTFQNVALFDRQTVRWNVRAGRFGRLSEFQAGALFHSRRWRQARQDADDVVEGLLQQAGLDVVADRPVWELPFGTRKRVELARALAMEPRLLLLDEPAAGLNHEEVGELERWIRSIRDKLGVSVLLIEHHMNMVMRTSDHVVVLEFGHKIADGTPAEVADSAQVQSAYLGGKT